MIPKRGRSFVISVASSASALDTRKEVFVRRILCVAVIRFATPCTVLSHYHRTMNARRVVLAVCSFLTLYTLISVFFKSSHIRIRRDADQTSFVRGYLLDRSDKRHISETRQSLAQNSSRAITDEEMEHHRKYNDSLAPEYYALQRALESAVWKSTELDRKSISQLEDGAKLANKQPDAVRRFPTTLIIGVRKGGTRALLAILNLHPQVKSCGREVHFFDQRYPRGLLWYLSKTPEILPEQQTIEKTPSYFVVQGVPQRIQDYSRAINKTLKFLVIFRDPSIRAVSDYVQIKSGSRAKYNKNLRTFEEVVMKNMSAGVINTDWTVVRTGVYSKHLERWLRYFPLKWFHFVSGEELVRKPYHEIKKVEAFLGLRPFFEKTNFVFNSEKGFPCFRGSSARSNMRCLGKAKGRTHPIVDSKIMDELRKYYRPYNRQLYKMVGRDFRWP